MKKLYFAWLFFVAFVFEMQAQELMKVEILNADSAVSRASLSRTDMFGNVAFRHDSAVLYCDSAYFYNAQNSLIAYSNVRLKMNDTLNLYSNKLSYSGNTRIAKATENVVLKDQSKTLYTDTLYYYRDSSYGYYTNFGRIVDEQNTLTSINGFYFTKKKQIHFKDSVTIFNEENRLLSDILVYHTNTKIAEIFSPTHIYGKENRYMYCEAGWYNTTNDDCDLRQNIYAVDKSQMTECERATYDSHLGLGRFYTNICMIDTAQNILLEGHYAEYHRHQHFGFMVDSAVAIMVDDQLDSLYLHADTLFMRTDSANSVSHLFAYHKAKFYKKSIQGSCDSIAFTVIDSTLCMYTQPILWENENQLTSDSMYFFLGENNIDSIHFYGNGFVLSRDTISGYNQVKGRLITAYFSDNEIRRINANGNAESLYYIREDDGDLIGIDKAVGARLYIIVENRTFKSVTYINGASATTYPESEFPKEAQRLKGFKLRQESRPLCKDDIFK